MASALAMFLFVALAALGVFALRGSFTMSGGTINGNITSNKD
jgi:hypothetical protein